MLTNNIKPLTRFLKGRLKKVPLSFFFRKTRRTGKRHFEGRSGSVLLCFLFPGKLDRQIRFWRLWLWVLYSISVTRSFNTYLHTHTHIRHSIFTLWQVEQFPFLSNVATLSDNPEKRDTTWRAIIGFSAFCYLKTAKRQVNDFNIGWR